MFFFEPLIFLFYRILRLGDDNSHQRNSGGYYVDWIFKCKFQSIPLCCAWSCRLNYAPKTHSEICRFVQMQRKQHDALLVSVGRNVSRICRIWIHIMQIWNLTLLKLQFAFYISYQIARSIIQREQTRDPCRMSKTLNQPKRLVFKQFELHKLVICLSCLHNLTKVINVISRSLIDVDNLKSQSNSLSQMFSFCLVMPTSAPAKHLQ